ncbi:acyl-CoA dehydrogenase [Caballeronia novacaledonica]|uniref:Acyl-CoA dehydrogenase n=1 Tax=Caballeronia novacaledonica TaxID=1544861 RepID=A0A2U3IDL4_9BURK|nr:MaoC family dehydratase N-terminal domain-containing protein [Caballeronia novacaledonica]SPB18212.1 acyl-CoA dehydrogenase [Caballeronia novacaledonica]
MHEKQHEFKSNLEESTGHVGEAVSAINLDRAWSATSESTDHISLTRAEALAATLDDGARPAAGDPLPELWHWTFFWPITATNGLGTDGHPKKGAFLPDLGLPRRMWAGGRLKFHRSLEIGKAASRDSKITKITEKSGRTGRLGFVTVTHRVTDECGVAIEEEQDIVYREAYAPGTPEPSPTAAPSGGAWQREIVPTETMLFRYSALTFNSHRIHYDRDYAIAEEGYPNLVVHGPLVATLLLDLVRRNTPNLAIKSFSFRAVRPTLLGHAFMVCGEPGVDGKSVELWAKDDEGWLTMRAEAEVE